jgi:hypothetical protein
MNKDCQLFEIFHVLHSNFWACVMMLLSAPPIDPSQIEELVRKLESDNLVLFIGAGISHQAKPYDKSARRLPLWRELAAETAGPGNLHRTISGISA